jgi:hypothetical protein
MRRSRTLSTAVTVALGLIATSVAMVPAQIAGAASSIVTNCKDSGVGSLRQAVLGASSGTTITFAPSPPCSVIALSGTMDIKVNLTIDGPGSSALTLVESVDQTIVDVASGVTATISGLTIADGATGIDNAGTLTVGNSTVLGNGSDSGGAIVNSGTLTLTGSTLSKNSVSVPDEGGGGIDNRGGTVTVTDSTLSGNTAASGAGGGGIYSSGGSITIAGSILSTNSAGEGNGGGIDVQGGKLTVTTSTLAGNTAIDGTGGGIDNGGGGTTAITDSTFSHNGAFYGIGGGGIYNGGTVTIADSTLSGNDALFGGEGGGVLNKGSLTITASTLWHNSASISGGGIEGPATVAGTIVAKSPLGGDCSGSLTDSGYNLDDDGTCKFSAGTDISDTAAGLDPEGLADNGGPTRTVALEAASPAIGAVKSAPLCSTPDQRGMSRPTPCDMGAVELVLPPQVITSPDSATATVGSPFSFTVTTTGVPTPTVTRRAGKLPKHVRLAKNDNGTATLSGTPTRAGVYHLTIGATFGKGTTDVVVTQDFTLTVLPGP